MRELHLTVPENWGKLTTEQLYFVSRMLLRELPQSLFTARCFNHFTGLKPLTCNHVMVNKIPSYLFRFGKEKYYIDADTYTSACENLEWLLGSVTLFKNPNKIGRYVGCNHKLYGLSFEQYFAADQMYIAFAQTNRTEFLNKFLAVFYTKEGEAWHEGKHLDKRAKRFRFVPMYKKYVVFLWFTGVKTWLIEKYPYLYSGSGSGETVSPADSLLNILSALNMGDVTRNPHIKLSPVHEALDTLNKKCETLSKQ